MLKNTLLILIFVFSIKSIAQDYSDFWEGHFSYLTIKDVSQGNDKIFAAAENAVFVYDLISEEINTISTINGLSGETISSMHYSEAYGLLLIGYENGLIEVVSDSNNDVLTVIDILEKQTIPPTNKKINHFNEYNDLVYISTDFGISVYSLANLEFGDTYFIGDLGSQIEINQSTIFNGFIYASSTTGLRKALVDNENLIDYQQWQLVSGSSTLYVQSVNDALYVVLPNRRIAEIINDSISVNLTYAANIVDVREVLDKLVITTLQGVFVYESNFTEIANSVPPEEFDIEFTCSTLDSSNQIFVGTTANIDQGFTGKGILITSFDNSTVFQELHPDGPLHNSTFSVETSNGDLWLTYGEYSIFYNPYPLTRRGLSRLMDDSWFHIPYDSVFGATELNKITMNPSNTEQVFISSFIDGILEVNDNTPTILYDNTNSGLESLVLPNNPSYIDIRVAGTAFDDAGLLWSVTSVVQEPLKSYNLNSNQWQSYSFNGIIDDEFSNLGFRELVIDNNQNKWITSQSYGVIGVKTNGSNAIIKTLKGESDQGNLPIDDVRALALDTRNQLWIGTSKGLRVLFNPESLFTEENVSANEIIIVEDGIPSELLFQQWISDIEVDGSNNKWIGTIATGLFYLSENGQETIFHFTKDNSPIPSNNIIDVSIDSSNGVIFIATDKGLVSFKSGSSKPQTDLQNAFVYPNPVRPRFDINQDRVKIKGISENINIKITDIEGNLVAEAQSNTNLRYKGFNLEIDGGTAFWNGKNLANNTVASGVYLVFLSDLDTLETKVLKLMVVR